MDSKLLSLTAVALLLSYCYIFYSNKVLLVIGILSAQDNFEKRQSIRDTWINLVKIDERAKYFFVIGADVCPIHPADRVSEWHCEPWEMSVPKDCCILWTGTRKLCDMPSSTFLFRVHNPVILLGIQVSCPAIFYRLHNQSTVCKTVIEDALSGQRLTSATVESYNTNLFHNQSFHTPLFLHSSYEVRVKFVIQTHPVLNDNSTDEIKKSQFTSQQFGWKFNGGILQLLEPTQNSSCLPVALNYAVHNVSGLENHINNSRKRKSEHNLKTEFLKQQLTAEQNEFGDIAFVPVIDTYDNLPVKLVTFFKWLQEWNWFSQPYFVLKTDDDVFVDAVNVLEELSSKTKRYNTWWASFREGWKPQRAGKWREPIHHQWHVYPPFPCGAGYVLSWDIVKRLIEISNRNMSWPQGEDVSVGVWLEDINPERYEGSCVWDCTISASQNIPLCNAGEQTRESMRLLWEAYKISGHISIRDIYEKRAV